MTNSGSGGILPRWYTYRRGVKIVLGRQRSEKTLVNLHQFIAWVREETDWGEVLSAGRGFMCSLSVYVGCDICHLPQQYLSVKGPSSLKERDRVIVTVIGPPRCSGKHRGYLIETRCRRYARSQSPV